MDASTQASDKVKDSVHSESWFVSAGDSNAEQEISLSFLMEKLIDIATAHANILGIGNPYMPNDHSGWVLSRAAIEMTEFPKTDSTITIDTWIENWNRHFSERNFAISDSSGKPLGYARQIWMVLDTLTRANAGLERLDFNEAYISSRLCPIPRQGKHQLLKLPEELAGDEKRVLVADSNPATYTFTYSDLDAYRHVNTVRYVRLLMNQFSLEEHDKYRVGRIEMAFLDEGAYGMKVEILRNCQIEKEDDGCKTVNLHIRDSEGKNPILFSKISLVPR